MRIWLIILTFLTLALPAQAQTGTPSSKLLVDQGAPDLATAQGYTYAYYPDSAVTSSPLVMTCTGTVSPFQCSAPFPAFTPGSHSLTITAKNAAGESAKSAPLTFTFVVVPTAPLNPRIGG